MPKAAAAAGKAAAGAKKGKAPRAHKLPERFPVGEVLDQTVFAKKKWQLGEVIGQGGFGLIYKAYDVADGPANLAQPYVVKIEPLENGPLFCEFHFYQRVAKQESILEWTKIKKLRYLALPQFLGAGQHKKGGKNYRYLILQHLGTDLQKLFEQNGRSFSEKTVFSVGLRMLDALEYIHDKGYCHADIKASNILLGYNNGKHDFNQVYLVDFGLAFRFLVDGTQKPYKEDPKRAHDGTAEYTSRDAHKGVYPSRRGDLEILGYCMLEWLSGGLPWDKSLANKDVVRDLKVKYMNDLPDLFKTCFGSKPCPEGLKKYFGIVSKLAYDEKPNYNQLRQFLRCSNEWNIGLSDLASPSKGVKRKTDSSSLPSPQKKSRPSTSPVRKTGGKAATPKSKSTPALVNGAGKSTPSTPKNKPKTPAKGKVTPSGGKRKVAGGAIVRKTPSEIIPGARNGSLDIIPGAAKGRRGPAKASPAVVKGKSPKAGAAKRAAASASGSATKVKAKSPKKAAPVKRKRNKNVTSSDTAVQTSPGFGLRPVA